MQLRKIYPVEIDGLETTDCRAGRIEHQLGGWSGYAVGGTFDVLLNAIVLLPTQQLGQNVALLSYNLRWVSWDQFPGAKMVDNVHQVRPFCPFVRSKRRTIS